MRDPIWLTFCAISLAAVAACALYRDGSIVGGATPDTTSVPCPDGTRCPNYAPLCPQYPGERCQADTPQIEMGAAGKCGGAWTARHQPCTYCVCMHDGGADDIAAKCQGACR